MLGEEEVALDVGDQVSIGDDDMGDEADGGGHYAEEEGPDLHVMAEDDDIGFRDEPDTGPDAPAHPCTGPTASPALAHPCIDPGASAEPCGFRHAAPNGEEERTGTEEAAAVAAEEQDDEGGGAAPREEKEQRDELGVVNAKDDLLAQPPHGSEAFVGGLSRDTTEDDLTELCAAYGEIYEVRLLKDKDRGENKGYAFITFTDRDSAEKAIEALNDSELKGKKLRFSQSQSKYRIFIGNVPKDWTREDLETALADKGPGIEIIELLKDPQNPSRNRGFCFVEYYNHACAENARKNMMHPSFKLGTNTPTVSWADPRGTDSGISQVKVVHVRNLPDTVIEEQLRELFECHGEITKIVLPASKPGQQKRDFGFIHFSDRSSALKAVEKTEKYELDGQVLEASLAKPEKRSESLYPIQRPGIMLNYQSRTGYGYGNSGMYGGLGSVYGSNRGFPQPYIYGRGPLPAGMTMVPMVLPDGRIGYVMQPQDLHGGSVSHRTGHSSRSGNRSNSGGSERSSHRYRPY